MLSTIDKREMVTYPGAVLQVAQAKKTDTWSTSSTNFVSVDGLTLTLTPSSATSKFLIAADVLVGAYWWQTAGGYFGINASGMGLVAGSGASNWCYQYGADSGNTVHETMQWTDSVIIAPGSIAPITFQVVMASTSTSYAIWVNRNYSGSTPPAPRSTLTVTEIAG